MSSFSDLTELEQSRFARKSQKKINVNNHKIAREKYINKLRKIEKKKDEDKIKEIERIEEYKQDQYNQGIRLETASRSSVELFGDEFKSTSFPELFDKTHFVGFDTCFNSTLKIYEIGNEDDVKSVSVNIWLYENAIDYWFRYKIRPNRIFLSDYDGMKVYDFKLNLIFERKLTLTQKENNNVYGFQVDKYNWDDFWLWIVIDETETCCNYDDKDKTIITEKVTIA